ncbi:MAG: hypothetical protein ACRBFS_20560 [Aureispira sp.]
MEDSIKKIEEWKEGTIEKVLQEIKGTATEQLLLDRYKNLLKLIGGKKLIDLALLPKKILGETAIKKIRWKPTETDQEILKALNIQRIWIDQTVFKALPSWFQYFNQEQITSISLTPWGKVELSKLPDWVFNCTHLETLSISSVHFKKPISLKKIESLGTIEHLSLSLENFIEAGIDLRKFEKIQTVSLSGNGGSLDQHLIEEQLESLGELSTLEELSLDYSLKTIPSSWLKLTQLKQLEIVGEVPTRFFSSTKETLGNQGQLPKELLSTEAVQFFLKIATTAEEDRRAEDFVFDYLESDDLIQIQKGLDILEQHPVLKQQAEERYLQLLKVLLNKPTAVLADLLALENPSKFAQLVQKIVYSTDGLSFSFEYVDAKDCLIVVNILGALTKEALDVDQLLEEVKALKNEEELADYMETQCLALKTYLRKEFCKGLLSNGWLQQILEVFSKSDYLDTKKLLFDHTDFGDADGANMLRRFYLFVRSFSYEYDPLYIDVAQSTIPDLTPVFWLFKEMPYVNWGKDIETEIFPASPLSFQRTVTYQEGDFGEEKSYTA